MKIEKLQPGMTVYDVHKTKAGNTTCYTMGCWPVLIVSVDVEKGKVDARWNVCNPVRTYGERTWSKWRAEKPLLIPTHIGHRLATRDEIKAYKAAKEGA